MHTSYGDMEYPNEVRRIIYTTNNVECFNHQLGNVTKNKGVFPTDDSLLKMLYLAAMDITRKWTDIDRIGAKSEHSFLYIIVFVS